jgi:hypothetical protein
MLRLHGWFPPLPEPPPSSSLRAIWRRGEKEGPEECGGVVQQSWRHGPFHTLSGEVTEEVVMPLTRQVVMRWELAATCDGSRLGNHRYSGGHTSHKVG